MPSPFQSDVVGDIFGALAKAQKTIQNPAKNAKNSHFKNTYTTLDEGLNVVRDALSAVDICVEPGEFWFQPLDWHCPGCLPGHWHSCCPRL